MREELLNVRQYIRYVLKRKRRIYEEGDARFLATGKIRTHLVANQKQKELNHDNDPDSKDKKARTVLDPTPEVKAVLGCVMHNVIILTK
jgi:hypothetical protein